MKKFVLTSLLCLWSPVIVLGTHPTGYSPPTLTSDSAVSLSSVVLTQTNATLSWDPNHPSEGVTGYKISWGTQSRVYTNTQDVGNVTTATAPRPATGSFYIAVQAYSPTATSPYSNEVVLPASAPPPPPIPPSLDVTAPTVRITSVRRSGNSANYTVTASITDAVGVAYAEFSVDNQQPARLLAAPWTVTLRIQTSGSHTITVRAYDAAGNVGIAQQTISR